MFQPLPMKRSKTIKHLKDHELPWKSESSGGSVTIIGGGGKSGFKSIN